jgi:hypothetical protein
MAISNIRFELEIWSIGKMIALIDAHSINLQPHYQRNAIWTLPAQRRLVKTIKDGYPLPNLFVKLMADGSYEMVDGQQRCRAILAYRDGFFADDEKVIMTQKGIKGTLASVEWRDTFLEYPIQISVLQKSVSSKDVEDFYVLVNQSGVKLNSAEIRKAEFYHTRVLALINELRSLDSFTKLALFTERSTERMNDAEFVSELLAYLLFGFNDKKEKLDDMFGDDIDEKQAAALRSRFEAIMRDFEILNDIYPVNRTRYKQKNDFYSLFAYFSQDTDRSREFTVYLYETLRKIEGHISPSQENCEPLMEYALNCVTQSNSKTAREARDAFFKALFVNRENTYNKTQLQILAFFDSASATPVTMLHRTLLPNKFLLLSG